MELVTFDEAYEWVQTQFEKLKSRVPIKKSRETSDPFYATPKDASLFLESNENASVYSSYTLTRDKWDLFCQFVKDHPGMRKTDLAQTENVRAYGSNLVFWPAVIHISRMVLQNSRDVTIIQNEMDPLFSVQKKKDYLISKVLSVFEKTAEDYDEFTDVSRTEYIFCSKKQSYKDDILFYTFYTAIVFTLSSKTDYPIIRLEVFLDKCTDRLNSYQLFLLTSTKERFSFERKKIDSAISNSKGIASVSLPYEIAKKVLRDGTQFSLRSQALRLDGELGFRMRHSSEIFRLMMNDKSFSDDEIDDLYDGVCDGEVEEKKYWERLRQLPDRAGKKWVEEEEVEIREKQRLEEKKRQEEEKRKQRLEEKKRQDEEEERKQRLEEEKRLEEEERKQQLEKKKPIEVEKKEGPAPSEQQELQNIKDAHWGWLFVGILGYWLTTRYATIWNVIGWILLIMAALISTFSVISDIKKYRRKK